MKVEVIKGASHSIELNFGETSVCITPDEAENLIAQLRAVVPVPAEEIEGTPQEVTLIPSNEDADKAAEEWAAAHDTGGFDCYGNAESNVDSLIPAFKAGIAWERERLMKEAVDGQVTEIDTSRFLDIDQDICDERLAECKDGDKVSVIIIKKEK